MCAQAVQGTDQANESTQVQRQEESQLQQTATCINEEARVVICGNPACRKEQEGEKFKICSSYKQIPYCSPQCQRAHWAAHKILCKRVDRERIVVTAKGFGKEEEKVTYSTRSMPEELRDQRAQCGKEDKGFFGSRKNERKVEQACQGASFVDMTHQQDVVTFAMSYSREVVRSLKKQGYDGLQDGNIKKLRRYLRQENYVVLLKYVWSEKNLDKKITWLTEYAKRGHIIFMLELCRALSFKISAVRSLDERQALLVEIFKWKMVAITSLKIDMACVDDPSLGVVFNTLSHGYRFQQLPGITQEIAERCRKEALPQVIAMMEEYPERITHLPSPTWLSYHGLARILGRPPMHPEQTWKSLRLSAHRGAMTELREVQ